MKWLAAIIGVLLLSVVAWKAITREVQKSPSIVTHQPAPVEASVPQAEVVEVAETVPALPKKREVVKAKRVKVSSAPIAAQPIPMSVEPMPVSAPMAIEITEVAPSKSPFDLSFFAGHAAGKKNQVRDFSEFLIEARYHFDEKTSIGLGQEAKKLYEIAATGEEEFLPGDTRLYLSRELSPDFMTIRWDAELGGTLPISKESRDTKHVTRPYLVLRASRSFFDNRLDIGWSNFISYSFNRYATSPTGEPLQKIVLGQGLDASVAIITNRLFLKGWAKGYYRTYEEFDYAVLSPASTQSFDIGSALALRVTDNIGIEAGVTRGTSVLNHVRYDSSSYDSEQTRVFAGLRISL